MLVRTLDQDHCSNIKAYLPYHLTTGMLCMFICRYPCIWFLRQSIYLDLDHPPVTLVSILLFALQKFWPCFALRSCLSRQGYHT